MYKLTISAFALALPFTLQAEIPAGYNHSASYEIDMGWNAYLTADYLYWHVSKENFLFYQSNNYQSGYQLGAGFNMRGMDNWEFYGEYTWFHSNRYDLIQEFSYDNAYVTLERPFYFGKQLIANYALGLRGRFMDETVGSYRQKSWALGPRFGLESNYLLGLGFRLFGDLSQSILFTRYSSLSSDFLLGSYNTLRAVTDTCLGIGWNSYLGKNNKMHIDLTAGYDFNIHWNQHITAEKLGGNVRLQGLNLGMRFDF